jgi:hypothetical protein
MLGSLTEERHRPAGEKHRDCCQNKETNRPEFARHKSLVLQETASGVADRERLCKRAVAFVREDNE